ncbi:hypothetical protein H4582DRAFT_1936972 [Lactarius indigo]|nr:hypothetical protein H4582DRAFT_1936972 [Lactarius indigo]
MDRDQHIQPGNNRSPHLFPDAFYTAPLDAWATAIQRVPSEAERCLIEQVVHYKALSDMEHEFLIVYACHPSGSKVVLGIDRNADVLTAAQEHAGSPEAAGAIVFAGIARRHARTDSCPTRPLCPSLDRFFSLAPRPSLLHLSVLLLTIRAHFPSYALLQYQCYFFARATCLALVDIFGGAEVQHEEGQRAATWRGVHVSLYSAGRAALQNMLLLPLVEFPVLIVPAGLFAVYSAVKLYDGNVVESDVDRQRISDEKIREHAIPPKYHAAWQVFVRDSAVVTN